MKSAFPSLAVTTNALVESINKEEGRDLKILSPAQTEGFNRGVALDMTSRAADIRWLRDSLHAPTKSVEVERDQDLK